MNERLSIGASPFEILTACAFTIFNDEKVRVGVIEVGMGGKLDATNILNNQAVSVISKIARDHEGFLGNTLEEIAIHKAGILRPRVPYIISPFNEENVQNVIEDYAREIGAGPRILDTTLGLDVGFYTTNRWRRATHNLEEFQRENLRLATMAVMQTLNSMDQPAQPKEFLRALLKHGKLRHAGRQELVHVPPVFRPSADGRSRVLVDGAHNPNAAVALEGFVRNRLRFGQTPATGRPPNGWPVTWVLAMTEGKDARQYLTTLLKPGDNVVTTTFGPVDGMPWVKPMDPIKLLELAQEIEPSITGVHVPIPGPLRALCTAKYLSDQQAAYAPIVMTGSLYLVGDFHRAMRTRNSPTWWTDTDEATVADREYMLKVQAEERNRANAVLSPETTPFSEVDDKKALANEIERLDSEMKRLEAEEEQLQKETSTQRLDEKPQITAPSLPSSSDQQLPEAARLELEEFRFLPSSSDQQSTDTARLELQETQSLPSPSSPQLTDAARLELEEIRYAESLLTPTQIQESREARRLNAEKAAESARKWQEHADAHARHWAQKRATKEKRREERERKRGWRKTKWEHRDRLREFAAARDQVDQKWWTWKRSTQEMPGEGDTPVRGGPADEKPEPSRPRSPSYNETRGRQTNRQMPMESDTPVRDGPADEMPKPPSPSSFTPPLTPTPSHLPLLPIFHLGAFPAP